MKRRWRNTIGVVLALAALALIASGAVLWLMNREREPSTLVAHTEPRTVFLPTCTVRWLTPEERLAASHPPPDRFGGRLPPPPADQKDNPLLYSNWFAVIRIENKTTETLRFFDFSGRGTRFLDAVIIKTEVRDQRGDVLNYPSSYYALSSGSNVDPVVPPASHLLAEPRPTLALSPGEATELSVSILSNYHHPEWGLIKPGTYTTRFTISYAEAPHGTAQRITLDPVTVTVTEDNIKACKAYWNTWRKE